MSDPAGLAAWLRLASCPGVGPARQRTLLTAFGLPEAVFAAGHGAVAKHIGSSLASELLAPADEAAIEHALAWAAQPGNHILTLADATYPRALFDITDPPVLLYVKGDPAWLNAPALAVVGARSATPQGLANARAFAQYLAERGIVIVSGLALGVDAAAHEGALAATTGATVAVIGTGADRVYPASHRELAHRIVAHGAIVSEFPLGTPPAAHNFPRRNRLIAGLARGVMVVEAALNSGSLITARLAAETGREVFAIPGSIHSPLARGCHKLIREGAKLVETAQDIFEEFGGQPLVASSAGSATGKAVRQGSTMTPAPPQRPAPADPAAAKVLADMGHDPVDLDTLVVRSGLTVDALYAILLALELDGHCVPQPGGRYQRL